MKVKYSINIYKFNSLIIVLLAIINMKVKYSIYIYKFNSLLIVLLAIHQLSEVPFRDEFFIIRLDNTETVSLDTNCSNNCIAYNKLQILGIIVCL
jgi:hypothetical protein